MLLCSNQKASDEYLMSGVLSACPVSVVTLRKIQFMSRSGVLLEYLCKILKWHIDFWIKLIYLCPICNVGSFNYARSNQHSTWLLLTHLDFLLAWFLFGLFHDVLVSGLQVFDFRSHRLQWLSDLIYYCVQIINDRPHFRHHFNLRLLH